MDLTEVKRLQRKVEIAKNNGNHKEAKDLYLELAGHHTEHEKYEEAIQAYHEVLSISEREGLTSDAALALRMIAETYCSLGEYQNAVKYSELYLSYSVKMKNKTEEQRGYATMGRIYFCWAEFLISEKSAKNVKNVASLLGESLNAYKKSLLICEKELTDIEDREKQEMKSRLHQNLGLVMMSIGKYNDAHQHFALAVQINKLWNFRENLYWCYINQAECHIKTSDFKNALAVLDLAMNVAISKECKSDALKLKAKVHFKMGSNNEAKVVLRQAYKLELGKEKETVEQLRMAVYLCKIEKQIMRCDKNDWEALKKLWEKKGDVYCALKQYSQGAIAYMEMLNYARKSCKSQKELLPCYTSLTQTYKDDEQYNLASIYCEKELSVMDKMSPEACRTYVYLGELLEFTNSQYSVVFSAYDRALKIAQKLGDKSQCIIALEHIIRVQEENGHRKEAEENRGVLERVKRDLGELSDHDDEGGDNFECDIECDVGDDELFSDSEDEKSKHQRRTCYKVKRNLKGETELHVAAIKGDYNKVKSLIERGHPVNETDLAGWTVLHEACNHGFVDIVDLLLKSGADVNHPGGKDCGGITPLHDAAENGHLEVIDQLLRKGVGTAVVTDAGDTPLDCLKRWRRANKMTSEESAMFEKICNALKTNLDSERLRKPCKRIGRSEPRSKAESPMRECRMGSAAELYRDAIQGLRRRPVPKAREKKIPLGPLIREEDAEVIMNDDWLDDDLKSPEKKRRIMHDPLDRIPRCKISQLRPDTPTNNFREGEEEEEEEDNDDEDEEGKGGKDFVILNDKDEEEEKDIGPPSPVLNISFSEPKTRPRERTKPSKPCETAMVHSKTDVAGTPKPNKKLELEPLKTLKIKILDEVISIDVLSSKLDTLNIEWLTEDAAGRYGVLHNRKPNLILKVEDKTLLPSDSIRRLLDEDIKCEIRGWKDMKLGDKYAFECVDRTLNAPITIVRNALNMSVHNGVLDLSDKQLEAKHLIPILNTLENEGIKLDALNLSRNFIEDEGIEVLMDYLERSTVTRLYLLCNGITWRGVKHFADRLETIPEDHLDKIEFLDFSFNLLKREATEHLNRIIARLPKLKAMETKLCKVTGPLKKCLGG